MDLDVDTENNTAKQKRKPSKKAAESKEQQDLDQLEKEQSNKTATQTEARSSKKVKVTSNRPKVQEPGFTVKSTKVLKEKAQALNSTKGLAGMLKEANLSKFNTAFARDGQNASKENIPPTSDKNSHNSMTNIIPETSKSQRNIRDNATLGNSLLQFPLPRNFSFRDELASIETTPAPYKTMMPVAINSTNSSLPQAQEVPLVSTACPTDTNYITLNPVPSTSIKTTGKLLSQVINGDDPSCISNINNTGGNYTFSEEASMSNFDNFDDSGVYDDGSNIFSLKEQIKELRKENDELKEKIKSLESSNNSSVLCSCPVPSQETIKFLQLQLAHFMDDNAHLSNDNPTVALTGSYRIRANLAPEKSSRAAVQLVDGLPYFVDRNKLRRAISVGNTRGPVQMRKKVIHLVFDDEELSNSCGQGLVWAEAVADGKKPLDEEKVTACKDHMIAFCLKNDLKEPTDREVNEQFTAAVTYARQKMKRGQAVKSKQ